jgi:transcriptional regulator with XRE-family HTH domain
MSALEAVKMLWLKHFREKNDKSQKNLADAVGVQENTVWRWENQKADPSASFINAIAKYLRISAGELLNGPASHEIEIRVVVEETNSWEVEKMNLTDNGPGTFSVHIGPSKVGIYVSGKFDGPEDVGRCVCESPKNGREDTCESRRLSGSDARRPEPSLERRR